jgi:hypothetical protein
MRRDEVRSRRMRRAQKPRLPGRRGLMISAAAGVVGDQRCRRLFVRAQYRSSSANMRRA